MALIIILTKLISLTCINILSGKPLPVYGDDQNIRDWLYVGDYCSALETVINKKNLR